LLSSSLSLLPPESPPYLLRYMKGTGFIVGKYIILFFANIRKHFWINKSYLPKNLIFIRK
jgi:hypothetical protein